MQKIGWWVAVFVGAIWWLLNFIGTLQTAKDLFKNRGEVMKAIGVVVTSQWFPLGLFLFGVAALFYLQFGLSWLSGKSSSIPAASYDATAVPRPSETESPTRRVIASPSLPVTKLSSKEIIDKVSAERPFQQKDVADAFIGTPVDWELFFVSVDRLKDDNAYLTFSGPVYRPPFISFEIPVKGHEYLRLVEKRERFRIKGTIKDVSLTGITLENVSLERISDGKTKAPKQP
jgi:hypothetical protein